MNAFDDMSYEILAEFLRTAVVIDDAAYQPEREGDKAPSTVKKPGRTPMKMDDELEPPAIRQNAHSLNTPLLVDSFARKGLVCAVIAPHVDEDIAKRLGPVAERCDIVIIDWQLFEDDGGRTLSLIRALCEQDCGDRLRLLCVYSGEPDLAKISAALSDTIGLEAVDGDDLLLRKDNTIVTILAKKGPLVSQKYEQVAVNEDEIAERLIQCFSGFTKGLLSNAVLAALAGIRRNAHRVVRKFDADLDPSYIAHRIMSVPVDNVESEILSLIASELESIVHQSKAGLYIDNMAIEQWMDSNAGRRIQTDGLQCGKEDALTILRGLIKNGADKMRDAPSEKFKAVCGHVFNGNFIRESKLAKLFGSPYPVAADRRFAMLSTLVTRYESFIPRLTLGTIIHDGTQYLLCLMPPCDSVRIPPEGRDFLFTRLVEDCEDVDLILQDGEMTVDLGVGRNPYHTVIYRLVPDGNARQITIQRTDDGVCEIIGRTIDGSDRALRWVGDMKPQVAQSFANDYASQVCRVGVNQSQWLQKLKKVKPKKV